MQIDLSSVQGWVGLLLTAALTLAGSAVAYGSLWSDVAHLRTDVTEIKADVKALMGKGAKP